MFPSLAPSRGGGFGGRAHQKSARYWCMIPNWCAGAISCAAAKAGSDAYVHIFYMFF
jgi:hypothetical protein